MEKRLHRIRIIPRRVRAAAEKFFTEPYRGEGWLFRFRTLENLFTGVVRKERTDERRRCAEAICRFCRKSSASSSRILSAFGIYEHQRPHEDQSIPCLASDIWKLGDPYEPQIISTRPPHHR